MSVQPSKRQLGIAAEAKRYFDQEYPVVVKAFGWPERKVVRMMYKLGETYYDCSGNGWAGAEHIDYVRVEFKIGSKTLHHNR